MSQQRKDKETEELTLQFQNHLDSSWCDMLSICSFAAISLSFLPAQHVCCGAAWCLDLYQSAFLHLGLYQFQPTRKHLKVWRKNKDENFTIEIFSLKCSNQRSPICGFLYSQSHPSAIAPPLFSALGLVRSLLHVQVMDCCTISCYFSISFPEVSTYIPVNNCFSLTQCKHYFPGLSPTDKPVTDFNY